MENKKTRYPMLQNLKPKKLTYLAPKFIQYGSIRELTLTAQKADTSDNPGMETNMTG